MKVCTSLYGDKGGRGEDWGWAGVGGGEVVEKTRGTKQLNDFERSL